MRKTINLFDEIICSEYFRFFVFHILYHSIKQLFTHIYTKRKYIEHCYCFIY